jgi:hypothetical protein
MRSSLCSDFPVRGPVTILCDDRAAVSLCEDCKQGRRVKHIDVIHHFAQVRVDSCEIPFFYCRSEDNVSDN